MKPKGLLHRPRLPDPVAVHHQREVRLNCCYCRCCCCFCCGCCYCCCCCCVVAAVASVVVVVIVVAAAIASIVVREFFCCCCCCFCCGFLLLLAIYLKCMFDYFVSTLFRHSLLNWQVTFRFNAMNKKLEINKISLSKYWSTSDTNK